jgi:glycerol-3-phosphate dehydrogenase
MLTLVPWRGRAIVGTGQTPHLVEPGDLAVSPAEIDAFIADANRAFPALKLAQSEVTLVHRGVVPATAESGRPPDLKTTSEILDHANGAFSIVGVKFTTARATAERAIELVARGLRRQLARSRTAIMPLPGAAIADHEALAIETARDLHMEVPLGAIKHLIALYAEGAAEIIRLVHDRPELAESLGSGTDTVKAEVVYTIRHEMAVRLADVLVRRTGAGSSGQPAADAIEAAAHIAQNELKWDATRTAEEIESVHQFYR